MGQKTHPYGLRLGIVTDWTARWYSDKDYAANVYEDYKIRTFLNTELKRGAISRIDIERIGDKQVQIDIHTGRPGVVIGRGGSEAERMRAGLEKLSGRRVKFNVVEVHNPEIDATLLARSVADQLEGRVSLHTFLADIDYGQATAATTVGAIGVKVWVYKGDIMKRVGSGGKAAAEARLATGGPADRDRRRSVKSRAEQAAGGTDKRIIEAGGGKRVVESGDARASGRRLIEAGGGKKVSAAEASAEFEEAKESAVAEDVVAEVVAEEAVVTEAVAEVAVEEATDEAAEAVVADVVAEEATDEAADADDSGEEK